MLRYRLGLRCCALLFLAGALRGEGAAQAQRGDSLSPYPLREVVVRASRTGASRDRLPAATSVISREAIADRNVASVGEALQLVPGVVVREYGGGGGIQTLSFRGMGSEQSLILIDGVPANNLQTGLVDLRMLPISDVSSIEVVRGGMSSLHGSNAMGGMINVRTDDSPDDSYVRLGAKAGSFGATGMTLSTRVPVEGVMIAAAVARERGSGRFPVRLEIDGASRDGVRENSDYCLEHSYVRADWNARESERRGFVAISASRMDRGSPGPLLTLENQGDGRQWDASLLAIASSQGSLGRSLEYSITASAQRADEKYSDATGLFQGVNDYRTFLAALSPVLHYAPESTWRLTTGWDIDAASASGNALRETERRTHLAWFAASEWRSDSSETARPSLSVMPSLRWEVFSSARPVCNPQVGASARYPLEGWTLRVHASAGRSFRVPTINELYYAGAGGYGNPSLSPEVARSAEGGIGAESLGFGRLSCDLTLYTTMTDDRIVWQPAGSSYLWTPVNIAQSRSRGFECEAEWMDRSGMAELSASYAYIDARNLTGSADANPAYDKQLPYVPLETASFALQLRMPVPNGVIRRIIFRLEDQFLGQRYTTDVNSESLPGMHLLSGNVGAVLGCFGGTATVKYEIKNLGDSSAEGMAGYPLPLRHHAVSFAFETSLGKDR